MSEGGLDGDAGRQMLSGGAGMGEAGRGTGAWHSIFDREVWHEPEKKETVINSRGKKKHKALT